MTLLTKNFLIKLLLELSRQGVFINYSFDKEHVPKIYEEFSTLIKKKVIDYPKIIFK